MNPHLVEATGIEERLIAFWFGVYGFWLLAVLVNFICAGIAAIHAARRQRTAWAIVITFFPYIGWIAYWVGKDEDPAVGVVYAKPGAIGPAGQLTRTENDVAQEVSAQISEEIRRRRAERGR